MNQTHSRHTSTAFFLLLLLVSSSLVSSVLFSNISTVSASGSGSFPPPSDAMWNITKPTVIEDEVLTLHKNVRIYDGGSLVLRRCYLIISNVDPHWNSLHIIVFNGGSLEIYDSTILTFSDDDPWHIFIDSDSHLILRDSILVGGWNKASSQAVEIWSDNNIIVNNFFTHTSDTIIIKDSSYNIIKDNYLCKCRIGISVRDNCAFTTIINNTIIEQIIGIHSGASNSIISSNTILNFATKGILLGGENNIVTDNIIGNGYIYGSCGIHMWISTNSLYSGNIIFNNSDYGIRINRGSVNNSIHHNVFFKNNRENNLSQAFDDGTNNSWFDPVNAIGNYWFDSNSSEPYSIDGLANAIDPFPRGTDFDKDKLLDYLEEHVYGTDPLNPDFDGDGLPDGWEVYYGSNPTTIDSFLDFDGDGLTNYQEYAISTNPLLPNNFFYLAGILPPITSVFAVSLKYLFVRTKKKKK